MKKVTVIIPVYNMEKYIEENLKCVTNQTYANLEILLIDDGSTDNSLEACRRAALSDSRITVFPKENGGPASARNFGLERASGDYVYFFDIDDTLKPEAIEKLTAAMEEKDVDLVVCGFEVFDGKRVVQTVIKTDGFYRTGEEARRDYGEQMYMYGEKGIQGAPWCKLFRMSVIRENGIEFPDIRKSEDDVFIARYVSHIRSFILIGDVLSRYYVNTFRRFWKKYPFDMFDSAVESTRYMLDIVYGWNKENKAVSDKIYSDYFQKIFGSFCFLFNPKLKLNTRKRYARIKEISKRFAAETPDGGFGVTHPVFYFIKQGKYVRIYIHMLLYCVRHMFD